MPHDGDEFHERLEAAKKALAAHEAEKQEPACTVVNDYNADGMGYRIDPGLPAGTKLYRFPQQEPDRLDAERLNWLLSKLPGDAIRYCVGELSDTCDEAEFRAAIDAAKEAKP